MRSYTLRLDETDMGWVASVQRPGGDFDTLLPDADSPDISSALENAARFLEALERFRELPVDVQKRLPGWELVKE